MNLSMFPSKFNTESYAREQNALVNAKNKKDRQVNNLNSTYQNASSFFECLQTGAGLGMLLGFILCCTSCGSGDAFSHFIGCSFLGACVGGPIWYFIEFACVSKANSDIQANVIKFTSDYSLQEKEIKERAEKERQEYLKAFEAEAQTRSVKFADSELAQEVITWMSEGFFRNIDAADRRSHIEQISVPFLFSIYAHKITCNLGTYDFELKRCENLKSAIDQTALARAIASTIQLNVMMKYPNDISGTAVSIMIKYTYKDNCVNALISYVAPNGSYEKVKSW